MNILVPISLFGCIPAILLIFTVLPPRHAVLFSYISAWLFLPVAGYDLPGLPAYTKASAASLGVLLATALFHCDRLLALRPRWFDLPMATWCLCPIASSLVNGLGLYDGLSTSFNYFVTWGLAYLIGRVYFTRPEHLLELAMGLVMGGLIYVPLCLWEIRMSPQLHRIVYGYALSWYGIVYGGFRPMLFMSCGLELGLWMTATATTGFWLWASGAVKVLRGYPFGWLVFALVATAVLCRVTGAWISLILGVSLWFLLKWSGTTRPALGLILVPVLYMATRSSGLWTGESAVELVRTVLNEKVLSLKTRIDNENMLVAKALQQPVFGWGGWGRARVTDENGKDVSVTDGMWVIAVGNNGLVGLTSFYAALLLPMAVLIRRYPARAWRTPTLAPACVLATLTCLYGIDCIANAMVNPLYLLALGGLTGTLSAPDRRAMTSQVQANRTNLSELLASLYDPGGHQAIPWDAGPPAGADPREEAAIRLGALGRSLREHGMVQEAEEAWSSALQHWAELAADYPDDPAYRKCWLDGLNDLAWSLISHPGLDEHDVARAIQLAEQTVALEPGGATYWNTLGIAYFRARDWKAAIHALERATELGDGGTSFDHYFLAMACWRQGDREQARRWYARGDAWMEQHSPDHEDLHRFRAEAAALLDSQPLPV